MFVFLSSPTFGFLLKLFSGLAAAGFGILGIGTKTRLDSGKLTKEGKVALVGILVAGAIGSIATINDFASNANSAAEAKKKSDHVLLSVRRGIFPFRGITADLELVLGDSFPGVREFKGRLTEARTQEKDCLQARSYFCRAVSINGVEERSYEVRIPSKVFPAQKSLLNATLRHTVIDVYVSRRVDVEDGKPPVAYKVLGVFLLGNKGALNEETVFIYHPKTDELTVFQRFKVDDEYVANAKVYSLVDFMPGALYASPDPHLEEILEFCAEMRGGQLGECRKRFPEASADSISIKDLLFRFEYPRELGMSAASGFNCPKDGQNWLTKIMPLDVDDGTFEGPAADRPIACEAFQHPQAR